MLKLLIEELLGHRLYWHAAIKSGYLLVEIAVLHFKKLNFAFQIKDNLFFSTEGNFNHFGNSSYINITLVTRFLAVA